MRRSRAELLGEVMRRRHHGPTAKNGLRRQAWLAIALAGAVALVAPAVSAAGLSAAPPLDKAALNLGRPQGDYVIGPEDKLTIRVFEVKDLSFDAEQVDASGDIELPLIGKVAAAGMTTAQLEHEIARRLGERYLQSPQVSVSVTEGASQKVTVEGEVKNPGVFQIKGRTTLMQAIAMAGGPDDQADLHKVAVIREDNGVRRAARCDYDAIRKGRAPDPVIEGNDEVVMDGSATKTLWSNLMKNLPIFTLLAYLR
jgi:polysaccharide export outer membrane protein